MFDSVKGTNYQKGTGQKKSFFDGMSCTDGFNNLVKGSFLAPEFQYVTIELVKCKPEGSKTCATKEKIEKFFLKHKLRLLMKDTYTDIDDPIKTMKTFPNTRYDTNLDAMITKTLDIFIESGSVKKSGLLGTSNSPTFKIGDIKNDYIHGGNDNYFTATVYRESKTMSVSRSEFGFTMWFVAIGGIERSYKKIFSLIVKNVTSRMWINAILGSLFLMKKNRDPTDCFDSSDEESPTFHGYGDEKKKEDDSDNHEGF